MLHFLLGLVIASWANAAAASAVSPTPVAPEVVRLDLSNFHIQPRRLSLVHGHSYVLELVNNSANGHDFTARRLFGSSRGAGTDEERPTTGPVDVPAHARVRIAFVPAETGRFEFHCGHPLHAVLGMRGRIDVL